MKMDNKTKINSGDNLRKYYILDQFDRIDEFPGAQYT